MSIADQGMFRRRLLIPETIQTSAMDCGPASLKSLLEGFGIHASYGRLREACQTEVDGTSIDQIEMAAAQLGLDAVQVMLPLDHVLAPESQSLPAIVVMRQAGGANHFVVVWRRFGAFLQIMDPAVGRRWISVSSFLSQVYLHTQSVAGSEWRVWAATDGFLQPLRSRLRKMGVRAEGCVATALVDPGPSAIACLDAAVRMVQALVKAKAIRAGRESERLIETLAQNGPAIPLPYWSAAPDTNQPHNVLMHGAVLVQVRGRKTELDLEALPAELAAALTEPPERPSVELLKFICADGLTNPAVVLGSLALATAGTLVEVVLLRSFFYLPHELTTNGQRLVSLIVLLLFGAALLLVDFSLTESIVRIGRKLESRLRLQWHHKIPRLQDQYFHSRPISDMAERNHNVHQLRQAPALTAAFLRNTFQMTWTVAGIAILYPDAVWATIAVAFAALAIPFALQPVLLERDLRVRTHSGALTRFYLDALLGSTAIHAHSAERIVRREQSGLLAEWARAGVHLRRAVVLVEGLQGWTCIAICIWIVWSRLTAGGDPMSILLLVYWILSLPALGTEIAGLMAQFPMHRNAMLRLMEPLGALEEPASLGAEAPQEESGQTRPSIGVYIRFDSVSVIAAGHTVLQGISLDIPPGSHLAVVGPSGAGKSTLAGLLLGWQKPALGHLTVDTKPLEGEILDRLRRETVWVDPQIQLWNRSLLSNLLYGTSSNPVSIDELLVEAELHDTLERLSGSLQTVLGEGGRRLSGGEGQRVRIGRAFARTDIRLVILDEPARGLEREKRRLIIKRARERWKAATLLCITHDIANVRDFERVIVIEGGQIVEDGNPATLSASVDSRFQKMVAAEQAVHNSLWANSRWRRLRVCNGKLDASD